MDASTTSRTAATPPLVPPPLLSTPASVSCLAVRDACGVVMVFGAEVLAARISRTAVDTLPESSRISAVSVASSSATA